jgi:hypothetical protein
MSFLDALAAEWPVIEAAPVLVIGGGLTLIFATIAVVWPLRGTIAKGTIDGLREQIKALEAHRKLAENQTVIGASEIEELKAKVTTLTAEYKAGAPPLQIASTTASVGTSIAAIESANTAAAAVLKLGPFLLFNDDGIVGMSDRPGRPQSTIKRST